MGTVTSLSLDGCDPPVYTMSDARMNSLMHSLGSLVLLNGNILHVEEKINILFSKEKEHNTKVQNT